MFYWINYIVCRIYSFVLNCEYLIISCKLFFNVEIYFDKNLEDKLLSVQHCDYLIVSVTIIYKILYIMSIIFLREKMLFKRLQTK